MARTAQQEMRGDAVFVTAEASYQCRLDSADGGARLYVFQRTGNNNTDLPSTALLRLGAQPNVTVVNLGIGTTQVRTRTGTNVVLLAAGESAELWATSTTSESWEFLKDTQAGVLFGLNDSRKPMQLRFTASRLNRVSLREEVAALFGYTATDGPVALDVVVERDVVIGGGTAADGPSMDTGTFPSGSTILLTLEAGAYISGSGGNGGQGMSDAGAGMTAGAAGGPALRIATPTTVVNGGRIQGGAGGGGGAARGQASSVNRPGGSGGGGAGAPAGKGGPALGSPPDPSTGGQPGTLLTAGTGGQSTTGTPIGGSGGAPGAAGSAGQSGLGGVAGAAGGAAGYALGYVTGVPYSVVSAGGSIVGTTVAL
jgi:hypothetical protein